jgi:hypothetical protein
MRAEAAVSVESTLRDGSAAGERRRRQKRNAEKHPHGEGNCQPPHPPFTLRDLQSTPSG